MKSYLEQLTIQSENQEINLRKAFEWAGLSKATYYRQLRGTELRYGTAIKIEKAIEQLATLKKK
jgi:predicted transcriptional regulator